MSQFLVSVIGDANAKGCLLDLREHASRLSEGREEFVLSSFSLVIRFFNKVHHVS